MKTTCEACKSENAILHYRDVYLCRDCAGRDYPSIIASIKAELARVRQEQIESFRVSVYHQDRAEKAEAELARVREQRDALEKALGPLAAWEIYGDEHDRPKLEIAARGVHSRLTIGDVLKARAAIERREGGGR